METIKLIPSKKNVIVRVCRYSFEKKTENLNRINFELHTMCDVPILTFKFRQPEDVIVVPVNFRAVAAWPKNELVIILQLFDLTQDTLFAEKEFTINSDDTETILTAKSEQQKMKKRQIDAIADFIHSDYIGFAGLSEVH